MKLTVSNSVNQKAAFCFLFFLKEYPVYDRISCKCKKPMMEFPFNKFEKARG